MKVKVSPTKFCVRKRKCLACNLYEISTQQFFSHHLPLLLLSSMYRYGCTKGLYLQDILPFRKILSI